MSTHSIESDRPSLAAMRNSGSAVEHFDLTLSDTQCFERALLEYRETSWDDSSFEQLPFEAQHTILSRAQDIKSHQDRLQAIVGIHARIAS
jgi:hypothetical protein